MTHPAVSARPHVISYVWSFFIFTRCIQIKYFRQPRTLVVVPTHLERTPNLRQMRNSTEKSHESSCSRGPTDPRNCLPTVRATLLILLSTRFKDPTAWLSHGREITCEYLLLSRPVSSLKHWPGPCTCSYHSSSCSNKDGSAVKLKSYSSWFLSHAPRQETVVILDTTLESIVTVSEAKVTP